MLLLSALAGLGLTMLLAQYWLNNGVLPVGLRYWFIFPILFALNLVSLAIESSGEWFQR